MRRPLLDGRQAQDSRNPPVCRTGHRHARTARAQHDVTLGRHIEGYGKHAVVAVEHGSHIGASYLADELDPAPRTDRMNGRRPTGHVSKQSRANQP